MSDCTNNILNLGSGRGSTQVYGIIANGYTNSMNTINFTAAKWNMEQNQFDGSYDDLNRLKDNNIVNLSYYDSFINEPRVVTLRNLITWNEDFITTSGGSTTGIIETGNDALIPPQYPLK